MVVWNNFNWHARKCINLHPPLFCVKKRKINIFSLLLIGEALLEKEVIVGCVYSSPALHCIQTAHHILEGKAFQYKQLLYWVAQVCCSTNVLFLLLQDNFLFSYLAKFKYHHPSHLQRYINVGIQKIGIQGNYSPALDKKLTLLFQQYAC